MPKKANTPVDPLQQALDSLVAKGLTEIIGTPNTRCAARPDHNNKR